MLRSKTALAYSFALGMLVLSSDAQFTSANAQESQTGTLTEIIPGHYLYNAGFQNSGVSVTDDGVLVVDGLNSEARGQHVRQLISETTEQPVRYLVSSTFHNNFTRGNAAYDDVIKIGHELHRADLVALMEEDNEPLDERAPRLTDVTYTDSMTLHLGGKEIQIIHIGPAHTRGDSIVYVPEDRIVYISELLFYDRFPWMNSGYVNWINAIDTILGMDVDIVVPGQGHENMFSAGFPGYSREKLMSFRQVLVDARDAVQREIDRGATEEDVLRTVLLSEYQDLGSYDRQREVVVSRTYRDLKGTLE
jgi:glyoxylase-like metal-dependent hydrolase (beta-lactamase superfamily II)